VTRSFWRSNTKFGLSNINQLQRALWSTKFRISDDRTKIVKRKINSTKPNLFVTHCLRPLWRLYHAAMIHKSSERLEKAMIFTGMTLTSKERKSIDSNKNKEAQQQQIRRLVIRRVVSTWLPLHHATLGMVVDVIPNPQEAMKRRAEVLFSSDERMSNDLVVRSVSSCDRSETAPVVVFVTKLIEIDSKSLSDYDELKDESRILLGFARVFSGILKSGTTKLYVNGHDDELILKPLSIYLMMGNREFRKVDSVSAGSVVAIRYLEDCVDKFATLSSEKTGCIMSRMRFRM